MLKNITTFIPIILSFPQINCTNLQNGDAFAVADHLHRLHVVAPRLRLDMYLFVVGAGQYDVRLLSEAALRQGDEEVGSLQRLVRRVVAHTAGRQHGIS